MLELLALHIVYDPQSFWNLEANHTNVYQVRVFWFLKLATTLHKTPGLLYLRYGLLFWELIWIGTF